MWGEIVKPGATFGERIKLLDVHAKAECRTFRTVLLLSEKQTWGSRPRLYDIAVSRL